MSGQRPTWFALGGELPDSFRRGRCVSNLARLSQLRCRPSHIVLPSIEQVASRDEVLAVILPKTLAHFDDRRLAAVGLKAFNQPQSKVFSGGHRVRLDGDPQLAISCLASVRDDDHR